MFMFIQYSLVKKTRNDDGDDGDGNERINQFLLK